MTAASWSIPAAHDAFTGQFGIDHMAVGHELTYIAHGLALIGERDDVAEWSN